MQQWNKIFKKHGKIFLEHYDEMPKIVKIFKKHNVEKILDLGCGSDGHTVYLAKKDLRFMDLIFLKKELSSQKNG